MRSVALRQRDALRVKIVCPKCQAEVRIDTKRQIAKHHVAEAVRTFARLPDDDIEHFFDYRMVCKLSGARCTLKVRR
jgi:hypothetical protein